MNNGLNGVEYNFQNKTNFRITYSFIYILNYSKNYSKKTILNISITLHNYTKYLITLISSQNVHHFLQYSEYKSGISFNNFKIYK